MEEHIIFFEEYAARFLYGELIELPLIKNEESKK